MDREHQPIPGSRIRLHSVESLEERWLLSGLTAPVDPAGEPPSPVADIAPTSLASVASAVADSSHEFSSAVEVVELEVATEDDDSAAVEIAPSNLPTAIVDTLDARFPGAEVVEAELSIEDGTPEYDVTAEWGGHLIGLTMMADGRIIEMERAVTAGELPRPVLEWVQQNFPGAVIDEADFVTQAGTESYELLIATPGQQAFEATLRVQGVGTPLSIPTAQETGERFDSVPTPVSGPVDVSQAISLSEGNAREAPLESETSAKPESEREAIQAAVAQEPSPERAESQKADSDRADAATNGDAEQGYSNTTATDTSTARVPGSRATDLVDTVRAIAESVASASPIAWLPQIAGVLSDVLPMDVAAVERGLQQLLDEIDLLAEIVTGDTAVTSAALRVAVIAGLITGAELVIIDSRKARGGLALESNTANSSWSWVLGTATPKRP